MPYDFARALSDGLTPSEINEYLAKKHGYRLDEAISDGVDESEIFLHLAGKEGVQDPYAGFKAQANLETMGAGERGLKRGAHELAAGVAGGGAAIANVLGAEGVQKSLEGVARGQQEAASTYPRSTKGLIESDWADKPMAAYETLAEQIPNLATFFTPGIAANAAIKGMALTGLKKALAVGASTLPMGAVEAGGNYNELLQEKGVVDQNGALTSLGTGGLAGLLEVAGGQARWFNWFEKAAPKTAPVLKSLAASADDGAIKAALKRGILEAGQQSFEEAGQELGQEGLSVLNAYVNDVPLATGDVALRLGESAAAGGLMGSLSGGVKGMVAPRRNIAQEIADARNKAKIEGGDILDQANAGAQVPVTPPPTMMDAQNIDELIAASHAELGAVPASGLINAGRGSLNALANAEQSALLNEYSGPTPPTPQERFEEEYKKYQVVPEGEGFKTQALTEPAKPFNYSADALVEGMDEKPLLINVSDQGKTIRRPSRPGPAAIAVENRPAPPTLRKFKTEKMASLYAREQVKAGKAEQGSLVVKPFDGGFIIRGITTEEAVKRNRIPEALRSAFDLMEEEVKAGSPGERNRVIPTGVGPDEIAHDKGTYPEWFKKVSPLKARLYGKTVSEGGWTRNEFFDLLGKQRRGEELTAKENSRWNELERIAESYNKNSPELEQRTDIDQMVANGFEPVQEEKPVVEYSQGDEIIVGPGSKVPADTYKHKGYDKDGSVILQDGTQQKVDDFDLLNIEGEKRNAEKISGDQEGAVAQGVVGEESKRFGGKGLQQPTEARRRTGDQKEEIEVPPTRPAASSPAERTPENAGGVMPPGARSKAEVLAEAVGKPGSIKPVAWRTLTEDQQIKQVVVDAVGQPLMVAKALDAKGKNGKAEEVRAKAIDNAEKLKAADGATTERLVNEEIEKHTAGIGGEEKGEVGGKSVVAGPGTETGRKPVPGDQEGAGAGAGEGVRVRQNQRQNLGASGEKTTEKQEVEGDKTGDILEDKKPEKIIAEFNAKNKTDLLYVGPENDKNGNVDSHTIKDMTTGSRMKGVEFLVDELSEKTIKETYQNKKKLFSRGDAKSGQTIQEVTAELESGPYRERVKKLMTEGRLKVVDEIPESATAGSVAGGAYDKKTDVIFIAASAIEKGSANNILLHESFHRSMARGEFKDLLAELERMEKLGAQKAWFKEARESAQVDKESLHYIEEIGAYAVQQYNEVSGMIRRWVDKFIAKVKFALMKTIGLRVGKLDPAMLREIAVIGLRMQSQGEKVSKTGENGADIGSTTDSEPASYPLFSRQPIKLFDSARDRITRIEEKHQVRSSLERAYTYLADRDFPKAKLQKQLGPQAFESDYLEVERLRGKKTADEVRLFREEKVLPILKHLADSKLKIGDMEELAYAMHAPEANLRLKRINAKMQLQQLANYFTEAEWHPYADRIIDIESDLEGNEIKDEYLALLAELADGLSERSETAESKDYGKSDRATKLKDNALRRIEGQEKLFARWDNVKDRLSGITDKEAADIEAKWKADSRYRQNMAAVKMMSDINAGKLKMLFDAGELDEKEYQSISGAYKNYVPLYRDDRDSGKGPSGRTTGPLGRPVKVRAGSIRDVVDIFGHTVDNYQAAITRKHKLEAGKTLYNMVLGNPDAAWSIVNVSKKPTIDGQGNVQMYPDMVEKENELHLKIDGERKILEVDRHDETMMRFLASIRETDAPMGPVLRQLYKVNRVLAALNTSLSPEFVMGNFMRDIQTAGINMEDAESKGMQKRVLKRIPEMIKAIFQAEKNGKQSDIYADFSRNGGKIGWMQSYENVEELGKELENEMKQFEEGHNFLKTRLKFTRWVSSINTSVENGVRLALYAELTGPNGPEGMTKRRAAKIVSDLTVDFTRRGSGGSAINALWMFYNAGVQGNARMIKGLARSPKIRKIAGGIIGFGFAAQMMGVLLGGDDDDGESFYEKMKRTDPATFERNMVFMLPGGKAIKIPMPYLYNSFFVLGNEAGSASYALAAGRRFRAGDGMGRAGSAILNSLNPLSAATLLQTLSPTITDPLVQVFENKAWHGGSLMPEQSIFGVPKPDSERFFKTVNPVFKGLAQGLNKSTGGDNVKPGMIDVSPETFEMLFETFTGSLGRFAKDTASLPATIMADDIPVRKVPFLRRVATETNEFTDSQLYRENSDEVMMYKERLKAADPEDREELKKDRLRMMLFYTQETEKRLDKINKAIRNIESFKGSDIKLNLLKKEAEKIRARYNKKFNETVR